MTFMGQLFVISAPSGAGKTSIVHGITAADKQIKVCISYTTRPRRKHEIDGEHYRFVSKPEFMQMVDDDLFLEYANVFQNYYGTAKDDVGNLVARGFDVVLEIDWQGAAQIRKKWADMVSIFILPPSLDSLRFRLEHRATDSREVIDLRLRQAKSDIAHAVEFDYWIVNRDLIQAIDELMTVIRSQRLKSNRQMASLDNFKMSDDDNTITIS